MKPIHMALILASLLPLSVMADDKGRKPTSHSAPATSQPAAANDPNALMGQAEQELAAGNYTAAEATVTKAALVMAKQTPLDTRRMADASFLMARILAESNQPAQLARASQAMRAVMALPQFNDPNNKVASAEVAYRAAISLARGSYASNYADNLSAVGYTTKNKVASDNIGMAMDLISRAINYVGVFWPKPREAAIRYQVFNARLWRGTQHAKSSVGTALVLASSEYGDDDPRTRFLRDWSQNPALAEPTIKPGQPHPFPEEWQRQR